MARGHGTYSRMVTWLKILLPLLALGVLGTVFLINSDEGFEVGFSFSPADLDTLESGSFLNRPQIDGVTDKGEPFHLVAEKITPVGGDQNLVLVTALSGRFTFNSGDWVKLEAPGARLDIAAQTLLLEKGGTLETSDGNFATVRRLEAWLSSGEMRGNGIVANGPLGQISAEQFRIAAAEGENRVLWFENRVKMVYTFENEGN